MTGTVGGVPTYYEHVRKLSRVVSRGVHKNTPVKHKHILSPTPSLQLPTYNGRSAIIGIPQLVFTFDEPV
jgi:hypothetical protein